MEQRFLIAAAGSYLRTGQNHEKLLSDKRLFPIGENIGFLNLASDIQVKFYNSDRKLIIDEAKIEKYKNTFCLKLKSEGLEAAIKRLHIADFLFIICEGTVERATVILYFIEKDAFIFESLEKQNPTLRLEMCDLPPAKITIIDVPLVITALYNLLAHDNDELFSVNTQRFLNTPHILAQLFAQVMSLSSADNINYISTLRVVADQLRVLLKPRIHKIEKDHNKLWCSFYGERLSFLDGGVSRVVSLPGTEPMGIRVGIYTVIPGERDPEKRESWKLESYVIGDVMNDHSIITAPNYRTDTKRLQEASRNILELLNALHYIDRANGDPPRLLLVHGPIQNQFNVYDEDDPSYVPGLSKEFLAKVGISMEDVTTMIDDIPRNRNKILLWNSCISIYLYIIKRLWSAKVPILGVVERASSESMTITAINSLVSEGTIPNSTGKRLKDCIKRYEIGDELLFGCILEEGEYLQPLEITKQKEFEHRTREDWRPVLKQYPSIRATMLKCSALNFPYRVEMPNVLELSELNMQMSLLYHMSLLLPNYAFPVGIDIADKYVKIPDWLSKGVSSRLTAAILKKVLEKGDINKLMQIRRLLALSPRDFFYRPRA
ncbi:MAG: DNA double-strand break repair nuclease NurA [Terracidiphilus sp.]|jgi:hypothetical protein